MTGGTMACDERLALLERYASEAQQRADKKNLWASAATGIALLTLLAVCFIGRLPPLAYFPVCGAITGAVLPLWKAAFDAQRWAETCARRVQEYCSK